MFSSSWAKILKCFSEFVRSPRVTTPNTRLLVGRCCLTGDLCSDGYFYRFTHFFDVALKRGDLEGAVSTCWSVAADLHEIRQRGETPASHTMRLLAAGGC